MNKNIMVVNPKDVELDDTVEVHYYFTEKDGKVWKVQSIDGGEWEWIETPYTKIPYIITRRMSKKELEYAK